MTKVVLAERICCVHWWHLVYSQCCTTTASLWFQNSSITPEEQPIPPKEASRPPPPVLAAASLLPGPWACLFWGDILRRCHGERGVGLAALTWCSVSGPCTAWRGWQHVLFHGWMPPTVRLDASHCTAALRLAHRLWKGSARWSAPSRCYK